MYKEIQSKLSIGAKKLLDKEYKERQSEKYVHWQLVFKL